MDRVWVDSDAAVADLLAAQQGQRAVAVDTEFRRRDTYFPQVALLQLCWNKTAYLIDPKEVTDLDPLRQLLTDHEVTKYLHSASEDLEVFDHWLGVLPRPLFDTQRAAGLLGPHAGQSYRALVEELLAIEVPKDETQSDWLKRPLSDAQQRYAALDVVYLREVGELLQEQAEGRGRLAWILEDGDAMAPGGRGPLAKFKSAWKLDDNQRQGLLALVSWREARARERDRPRNWIADDRVLMAIATRLPGSMEALESIDVVPEALANRQGRHILRALEQSRSAPGTEDWAPAAPLSRRQKDYARGLVEERDQIASDLGMAPSVLLSNRELELLVREAAGEPIEAPVHWDGWRAAQAVAPLRRLAGAQVA